MIPLREPKLSGEDEVTQMMLDAGVFPRDSEAVQKLMDVRYSSLKIPLVRARNILTAKESNKIKFCGKDEAEKQLLPLLRAIQSNTTPIEGSKYIFRAGVTHFGVLVRILARASTDPNIVLETMSTYVLELYDFTQHLKY
jgi:hypothetical protein